MTPLSLYGVLVIASAGACAWLAWRDRVRRERRDRVRMARHVRGMR